MKLLKNVALLLLMFLTVSFVLTGCGKTNTIEKYVITNEQYRSKEELKNANQPEEVTAGKTIYASVYFIESPKGMEYAGKWYLDDKEIKSDTQEMPTNQQGIITFSLDGDQVMAGTLKFQVVYEDDILCSKELTVK